MRDGRTDPRFNGLNGDILLNAPNLPVGRVDGESYGYKRSLLVTVDLRIERLRRQADYETITHDRVAAPLDFAITTAVWRPDGRDIVAGGATVEPLRNLASYSRGFDAATAGQLANLERWHLNSMRAACAHMDPATLVREPDGYGGTRIACRPNVCPVNGDYYYGQAWLVEPLPSTFVADLLDLLAGVDMTRVYVHPDLTPGGES